MGASCPQSPQLCLLPCYFSGGVQGTHWLPAPAGGPAEPRAPHPPAATGTTQHGENWTWGLGPKGSWPEPVPYPGGLLTMASAM